MFTHHNPDTIIQPASKYSQAVAASATARWLYVSGQIGLTAEGNLAGDSAAQMAQCWHNIMEILADADMGPENLVKITAYLTNAEDIGIYREIRDRMINGQKTASTMVVISALARPDLTVEIEAIAAS